MKTIKPGQSQKCVEALKALYAPPLSAEEHAHYNSLRAAEMARAMARRNPAPDLIEDSRNGTNQNN